MDQQQNNNTNTIVTVALVLGIVSLVLSFMSFTFYASILGLIAGIIGAVLATNAKKNGVVGGMQTGAMVISIIGIVFNGIGFVACVICAGAIGLMAGY